MKPEQGAELVLTALNKDPKKLRKLYYKIGEVCKLTGLPHHVIRFWEKEFPQLSPRKTSTGHRIFNDKDIEMILLIKELLYVKKYTIKGAKDFIASGKKESPSEQAEGAAPGRKQKKQLLEHINKIRSLLERKPPV